MRYPANVAGISSHVRRARGVSVSTAFRDQTAHGEMIGVCTVLIDRRGHLDVLHPGGALRTALHPRWDGSCLCDVNVAWRLSVESLPRANNTWVDDRILCRAHGLKNPYWYTVSGTYSWTASYRIGIGPEHVRMSQRYR